MGSFKVRACGLRACQVGLVLAVTCVAARFVGAQQPSVPDKGLTVESLTGSAVSDVGPYYQDVDDAIKRFNARDVEGARKLLEAAKQKERRLPPPEIMMAQMGFATGQSAFARGELENAIRNAPKDPEAYALLGKSALAEGRYTDASLEFAKALAVAAEFDQNAKRKKAVELLVNNAAALADENREEWKAARDHLQAWIKLEPESAVAHRRLAHALAKLGDYKQAYAEFQAAYKADPKLGSPEINMAREYRMAKDKANTEKWFNLVQKRGGQDSSSQVSMGDWHYENNQLEQAVKYADQAIKLDPQNYEARLLRGAIARMQGDTKTAQQQLETAHLLAPNNTVVLNHLALVLADQDDEDSHKRALQFAEILYRLSPYSMDAVSTLGWANYRLGNTAEAERLFRTFSTTNQMPLDTGYFQATMLKDQGRVQQAAALLALVLNSESPFVYRRQAEEMLAQLKKGSAGPPSIEKAGEKN